MNKNIVHLLIYPKLDFEYITLEFDDNVDIIATSKGHIKNNMIIVDEECHSLPVDLMCPQEMNNVNCSLVYYKNGDIQQDTQEFFIHNTIKKQVIREYRDIEKAESNWKLSISIEHNGLKVEIKEKNSHNIFVSFGEKEEVVSYSDFIFAILDDVKSFMIPIELIEKNRKNYSNNSEIGCSELIKGNHFSLNNIYYKIPISNFIRISDFPSINKNNVVSDFKDPFGRILDFKSWTMDKFSNLPVKNVK